MSVVFFKYSSDMEITLQHQYQV